MIAAVISSTCIIVLFTFLKLFYFFTFLSLAYWSANSLSYCLVLLSLHSTVTVSSFINPINGGRKKGHWGFLESSSKARLCVYSLRKGWAQGCGACSLLQRCLVCHLTVDCCTATIIPPPAHCSANRSCYIFHSKNARGHQHV